MLSDPFLPLTEGVVDGTRWHHRVLDLGTLRVPSGLIEASDPFVNLGQGLVVEVPKGDYPVRATIADVSDAQDGSHLREAYVSVVLADGDGVTARTLNPGGAPPPDGEFYGVPVDAGTVAFADAEALARCMPDGNWYDDLFDTGRDDSWFALMDSPDHLAAGYANIVMPLAQAGENVVLAHSGWGDGFYPLVGTYDADGLLVAIHLDLGVDERPE